VDSFEHYYTKFLIDPAFETTQPSQNPLNANRLVDHQNNAIALADGSYDLPFLTIQAAVNAAQPGDVVQVAPGTYAGGINLTARDIKLIAMPGQRDATIITGGVFGLDFGAANTNGTMVAGFTIQGATSAAMRVQSGANPLIANCLIKANASGIDVNSSSPLIFNSVISSQTNTAASGNGIVANGSGLACVTNCTIVDNQRQAGSGQIRAVNGAAIEMRNCIVRSDSVTGLGTQIVTGSSGSATVNYSNIAQAYTGIGNIDTAPLFDAAFPTDKRIQRLSSGVDAADIRGLPGFLYHTRRDFDGEQRGLAYNAGIPSGLADMGADEFVSRLTFATITRDVNGANVPLSEVDEASDIASLGQIPGTGDARISVINDETITDTNGNDINRTSLFTISAVTGDISATQSIDLRRGAGGANEVKDAEAVCWDFDNNRLLVVTSQTKVNKYRDCEGTNIDPLIDPPVNDYDPRRANLVSYDVNTSLIAQSNPARYDSADGAWLGMNPARRDMDAFIEGISQLNGNAVSATGFDSPAGLVASLRAGIQGNAAYPNLQQTNLLNGGVLIAWSTSPKFGTPVNGTQYSAGTLIPYTGLGGPGFGGTSLGNQSATSGNAGIVHSGRVANTTYYYRAWPRDAAFNYGRPIDAQTTTTGNPPILVNEIEGSGVDFIEVFNASGVAVNVGGQALRDDNLTRGAAQVFTFPANTIIQARTLIAVGPFNFGIGNGGDDGTLFVNATVGIQPYTRYGRFNRDQEATGGPWLGLSNAEGRVWDGGPRGYQWDAGQMRFEAVGAVYQSSVGSPQPISLGRDQWLSNSYKHSRRSIGVAYRRYVCYQ
jgi:hypothetical protein